MKDGNGKSQGKGQGKWREGKRLGLSIIQRWMRDVVLGDDDGPVDQHLGKNPSQMGKSPSRMWTIGCGIPLALLLHPKGLFCLPHSSSHSVFGLDEQDQIGLDQESDGTVCGMVV